MDVLTTATNNEIPAGVPFIYINKDGKTNPSFTILNNDVIGVTANQSFRGILLKTQFNDSDFRYASTLSFGYKSNQAYWLETDGGKTSVGFRKPSNTTSFGPNKGCVYVESATTSSPEKPTLCILFEATTTGINEVMRSTIADDAFYDLQGRRVSRPSNGVYIHHGK